MDELLIALIVAALVSPVFAVGFAIYCYWRYRKGPQPKRPFHIAGLILALLVAAPVFYWLGSGLGISVACSSTTSSNLCGLFGFFVLGPIAAALAIIIASKIWLSHARKAL
jgi:hypothetical protein